MHFIHSTAHLFFECLVLPPLCPSWRLLRLMSRTFPKSPSYLQQHDQLFFPPAGMSATRAAGTESWKTCMKMMHLQSVEIKLWNMEEKVNFVLYILHYNSPLILLSACCSLILAYKCNNSVIFERWLTH